MSELEQPTAADRVALERFWTGALARLEAFLEGKHRATATPIPPEGGSNE